jgi:heptose-I-phosphate ethanolaminephosphotransferase
MITFFKTSIFKNIVWGDWLRLYCFFAYFSVLPQLILYCIGNTKFNGLRQALLISLLWLIPVMLFPKHVKKIAAALGVVLFAASLVSLGYFFIYGQEFSQSVIFTVRQPVFKMVDAGGFSGACGCRVLALETHQAG